MRIRIITALLSVMAALSAHGEVTIEQCVEKAMANYPAIRKYNLIASANEVELSDINKGWLPRIGVYGQATLQNVVPSFPEALSDVLQNMGQEVKGMGKLQYKVGVDVNQTIWDGGASKARREMSRSQQAVEQASLDVELYKVRQQVENLYFAILLTDEQIAQSQITHRLLCDNLNRLRSMLLNGVAMQADVDMVEAQALSVKQNILQARSASSGYRKALELFIGESLEDETLAMPSGVVSPDAESNRPELNLFERRLELNKAADRIAGSSRLPSIGLFAQSYYGYPGFKYFKSMISRDMSFNIIAGVKVAWNIDSFYTRKNTSKLTSIKAAEISTDREVFLFNTRVQSASLTETIKGIRDLMDDDARIVELRTNVRKAAESQLVNGVIDVTALLSKISDENIALLTSKYHEILLMQEIYKLKYTLDR